MFLYSKQTGEPPLSTHIKHNKEGDITRNNVALFFIQPVVNNLKPSFLYGIESNVRIQKDEAELRQAQIKLYNYDKFRARNGKSQSQSLDQ